MATRRSDKTREEIARILRALSEPMRLRLLEELQDGPRQFGELVDALDSAPSWTSKQLKNLHEAGLISRRKEQTKVWFSLRDDVAEKVCQTVCTVRKLEPKATSRAARPEQATLFDF